LKRNCECPRRTQAGRNGDRALLGRNCTCPSSAHVGPCPFLATPAKREPLEPGHEKHGHKKGEREGGRARPDAEQGLIERLNTSDLAETGSFLSFPIGAAYAPSFRQTASDEKTRFGEKPKRSRLPPQSKLTRGKDEEERERRPRPLTVRSTSRSCRHRCAHL
jgi:hypothetical protein